MTRRLQANGPLGAGVLDGLAGRHAGTNALLDPGRLAGETGRTALHKLIRGVVANRAVFSQFSLSESQLWCAPTIPAGLACGQRCVCVCVSVSLGAGSVRQACHACRTRSITGYDMAHSEKDRTRFGFEFWSIGGGRYWGSLRYKHTLYDNS